MHYIYNKHTLNIDIYGIILSLTFFLSFAIETQQYFDRF